MCFGLVGVFNVGKIRSHAKCGFTLRPQRNKAACDIVIDDAPPLQWQLARVAVVYNTQVTTA